MGHPTANRPSVIAKRVLIGVGLLFVVSGLIVGAMRLAKAIPPSYGWLAPMFLALGAIGALTAWFGLRHGRRWPLPILGGTAFLDEATRKILAAKGLDAFEEE